MYDVGQTSVFLPSIISERRKLATENIRYFSVGRRAPNSPDGREKQVLPALPYLGIEVPPLAALLRARSIGYRCGPSDRLDPQNRERDLSSTAAAHRTKSEARFTGGYRNPH